MRSLGKEYVEVFEFFNEEERGKIVHSGWEDYSPFMSNITQACPQCTLEETYLQGAQYVCHVCGYEWPADLSEEDVEEEIVRDANGTALSDGDTVLVIKDLKVKGSSTNLKVGTKLKNIRLVGGDHGVEAGSFKLKAEFLRKS